MSRLARPARPVARKGPPPQALADLPNFGPQSQQWLQAVGIRTIADLRAQDPYEVYARLRANIPGVSLTMLYAILGAVEDRSWLDIKRERRTAILLELERRGLLDRGPARRRGHMP